jgi:hypothetical protein
MNISQRKKPDAKIYVRNRKKDVKMQKKVEKEEEERKNRDKEGQKK